MRYSDYMEGPSVPRARVPLLGGENPSSGWELD